MKCSRLPRVVLAAALVACSLTTTGCGGMLRRSVKDGLLNYVVGSVSSGLDTALFGDFITSVFTGGFGGGRGTLTVP